MAVMKPMWRRRNQIDDEVSLLFGDITDTTERIFVATVVMLALSWVMVLLRIWVRAITIRQVGLDDWFLVLSLVLYTVQNGFMIEMCLIVQNNQANQVPNIFRDFLVQDGISSLVSATVKISFGLLLLRIFTKLWHRWVVGTFLVVHTMICIGAFFFTIFVCGNPQHALFELMQGHCSSVFVGAPVGWLQGVTSALMDWVFVAISCWIIWRLQLALEMKLAATCIFFIGSAGSIIAVYRLHILSELTKFGIGQEQALLTITTELQYWIVLDGGICITAVSLTALQPLAKSWLGVSNSVLSAIKSFIVNIALSRKTATNDTTSGIRGSVSKERWIIQGRGVDISFEQATPTHAMAFPRIWIPDTPQDAKLFGTCATITRNSTMNHAEEVEDASLELKALERRRDSSSGISGTSKESTASTAKSYMSTTEIIEPNYVGIRRSRTSLGLLDRAA